MSEPRMKVGEELMVFCNLLRTTRAYVPLDPIFRPLSELDFSATSTSTVTTLNLLQSFEEK